MGSVWMNDRFLSNMSLKAANLLMNVLLYGKHTGQEGESIPSQPLRGHMLVAFVGVNG